MTTIIAYRTPEVGYMIGDRCAEVDGAIKIDVTKIYQYNGWLIGIAGSLGIACKVIDQFKKEFPDRSKKPTLIVDTLEPMGEEIWSASASSGMMLPESASPVLCNIPYAPPWFAEQLKKEASEDNDVTLLLINQDFTYVVGSDGYFLVEEDFYSIGAGAPFAYGAYEMAKRCGGLKSNGIALFTIEERLEHIMDICAKRSPGTSNKYDVLTLGNK